MRALEGHGGPGGGVVSDEIRRYEMFIDGRWQGARSQRCVSSVNPATEQVWAEFQDAEAEDVGHAVTAANRAFEDGPWRRMSATERGRMLRRIADRLASAQEHLGRIESIDTGKLLRETRWQASNVAQVYEYYAGLADKLQGDVPPAGQDQLLSIVLREPVGVVAAVVPWNSQLQLAAYKIAPALAAGNTVVLKPSENASAAILEFMNLVAECDLPPGVLNVVTGAASCGAALTSHPQVRRITFTGGVETARKVIPNTANNIARLSLELGGKSPVIVCEDADLESAVNGVLAGIFAASGQSCAAGSRLLLHKKVYDKVLDRLIERAPHIRIGDPLDPDTEMGPLATQAQLGRIQGALAASTNQGARILTGGGRPSALARGYFFEPTIVACEHQDYPVVRDELFGPVLSVLRFSDEDEAIRLANSSRYAFAGGVFSINVARALRLSRGLRAGRVWINTYRASSPLVPFGGFKESGYGREAGLDAIRDFTETKALMIDTTGRPVADPFVMR